MAADRAAVETEMAYTPFEGGGCRDPQITADGDLRQCRRRRGHDGPHASGFGAGHEQWGAS